MQICCFKNIQERNERKNTLSTDLGNTTLRMCRLSGVGNHMMMHRSHKWLYQNWYQQTNLLFKLMILGLCCNYISGVLLQESASVQESLNLLGMNLLGNVWTTYMTPGFSVHSYAQTHFHVHMYTTRKESPDWHVLSWNTTVVGGDRR